MQMAQLRMHHGSSALFDAPHPVCRRFMRRMENLTRSCNLGPAHRNGNTNRNLSIALPIHGQHTESMYVKHRRQETNCDSSPCGVTISTISTRYQQRYKNSKSCGMFACRRSSRSLQSPQSLPFLPCVLMAHLCRAGNEREWRVTNSRHKHAKLSYYNTVDWTRTLSKGNPYHAMLGMAFDRSARNFGLCMTCRWLCAGSE